MLVVENLIKKFGGHVVVDNISFFVDKGEIFAILGPNGAGKTTTVKMIVGLLKPNSGRIIVDGIDAVKQPIDAKRLISYIPDEPFVYHNLTGREFLRFILRIYNMEVSDNEIDEIADYFGILNDIDRLLSTYSHGMKQKILIASSLLRKPKLMIFDEPTVGLDPISVKRFREYMIRLKKEGVSIIMCTHILELAEKICDKVCVLEKGRIVYNGRIDDVLKDKDLEKFFFDLVGS